ncbi:MAG: signal peptidase II [Arthrobacter sp.]
MSSSKTTTTMTIKDSQVPSDVAPATKFTRRARSYRKPALLLLGAGLVAGLDLAVKDAAETFLASGTVVDLGALTLKLHYNTGVAFSLGANLPAWAVAGGTGAVIAALLCYLLAVASTMNLLSSAGAGMLLGGAAGNFIDRLDGRGVVDYLHTGWFPTFNLADAFVTLGLAALILGTLQRRVPRRR